jgi:hypothetical protein
MKPAQAGFVVFVAANLFAQSEMMGDTTTLRKA